MSFLLLVSGSDAPLAPAHVASLGRWPAAPLPAPVRTRRVWLSGDARVGFVGWTTTRAGGDDPWHVGDHGVTAAAGPPWSAVRGRIRADDLTARTTPASPTGLEDLRGTWCVLRIAPDGRGWVAADAAGAGAVHVARTDGVVAISDRAELAAAAAGRRGRSSDLAALATDGVQDPGAAWQATRTVPPGRWLRLSPGTGVELHGDPRRAGTRGDRSDAVAGAITAAAAHPGDRVLDLDGDPAATVLAAAVRATGTADRFTFRAVGSAADRDVAATLARALGVPLDQAPPQAVGSPSALDLWTQLVAARTEAAVLPPLVAGVTAADADVVVHAAPLGLRPRVRARVSAATAALFGGAVTLDPIAPDAVEGPADPGVLSELLRDLDPTWDVAPPTPPARMTLGWEHLGPVLLARRAPVTALLERAGGDLDALVADLAATDRPSEDLCRRAWSALLVGVWQSGAGRAAQRVRRPASSATPSGPGRVTVTSHASDAPPTLVTGVTSRSLPEMLGRGVPPTALRTDALLGTGVDGAVADLCTAVLCAVEATETDPPEDLAERLASTGTAPLAALARELVAQRDGVLTDARLGLLLPFWTTHVHPSPRLILVDERPAELLTLTRSRLPSDDLLLLWTEVVVATLLGADDVRVVDPRDVADVAVPEGLSPDVDHGAGGLRLATLVDGLVRELDADEITPLLRAVHASRRRRSGGPASSPQDTEMLDAVDAVWADARRLRQEARHATSEATALAGRVAQLEQELASLRSNPAVRLALRLPRRGHSGGHRSGPGASR